MPPPQQKPTAPTLPVDSAWDHLARLVLVGGRAAERREHIDRQCQEAFQRKPARHVLDMRVEAAVFVDDKDGRAFDFVLAAHQLPRDLCAGGVIRRRVDGKPRIIRRDHRCPGVIVLQQRQQRGGGRGRAGEFGQPIEEIAPAHAAMGECVVAVDDLLVERRAIMLLPIFFGVNLATGAIFCG
jgi:hypothetical protein